MSNVFYFQAHWHCLNDEAMLANISEYMLKGLANNYIPVVASKAQDIKFQFNLKPAGGAD